MTTSESTQFLRRIDILEEPSEEQIQNLLEIETSDHAEAPQPQNEQYGLFHLNSSTSQVPESPPQDACKLDVIAVHGLGGDAYRTWQHENGFNWLQHLEEEFAGIRVYSYGYDSGVAFSGGTVSLTDCARHLLSLVKMTRSSEKVRPAPGSTVHMTDKEQEEDRKIVFVCHSLGGLLVKQVSLSCRCEGQAVNSKGVSPRKQRERIIWIPSTVNLCDTILCDASNGDTFRILRRCALQHCRCHGLCKYQRQAAGRLQESCSRVDTVKRNSTMSVG